MTAGGLPAIAPAGWPEPATLAVMLGVFAALAVWRRWPIGVSLLAGAWAGAAVNGDLLPHRHLIEGAFSYLDPILVIVTAMIFMRALADGGALACIVGAVERRLGGRPALLLPMLMVIVMFPGMVTGSSTASVLATGTMVGPVLVGLGLCAERAAAIIAMGGVLGMIAPPINIPAMIIGSGIDLPYVGFAAPLALASFPAALLIVYWLGWPLLRQRAGRAAMAGLAGAGATAASPFSLWRALAAPLAAAALMIAPRAWPSAVPDYGLPLAFLISAAVAVVVSPRFGVVRSLVAATEDVLPVAGILTGVGAFIQVMTVTGGRGWLVALMLAAPAWALVGAAAVSVPAFGAVSAFGSASVLGVPFLLSMLGRDEVVTAAALSSLAGLGDLMLPAAIAATLAARALGISDRRRVLRRCVLPAAAIALVAAAMLAWSPQIGRWLR
ncbi:MAG TPA: Na+/H+ antiporter NhaC family protein [Vicinamibacterales bacterium]|nr:Na+/H+ antiporter NhaC family protein [Vicinamibacterales bacterium]HOQ59656.1 Na+/H+ antiporter NhaC family protein [Vicinamibacterales bacterium]HPK70492.1 Na+/H+ antiporter NhaC family protein [Vicinamibacterales bacterium]HPW21364.1 Na+/H+ antiporter NhaC family protein [Vicinamibacterales bacterium]